MEKLLAKSDGTLLINHSVDTAELAVFLFRNNFVENDDLEESIRLASLLHDIGKATKSFQTILNGEESEESFKYLHNEISWYICRKYLSTKTSEILNIVCNAVFFHHGLYTNPYGKGDYTYKASDIANSLSVDDETMMVNLLKHLVDTEDIEERDEYSFEPPKFYESDKEINANVITARACLISADRLISKYPQATMDELKELSCIYNVNIDLTVDSFEFNGTERFNKQIEIIDSSERTTLVKAPAGFGKTLLGILWVKKHNKRTIWVCPNNTVSKSVYKSVLNELNRFKDNKVSVELYLTGERIDSNSDNEVFTSDIIITNIDNYLSSTSNNTVFHRMYDVLSYNVIFDEYHELVGETPLFSLFIDMMYIRNRKTSSNTLLLTATPIPVNTLWESIGSRTTILPSETEHYKAVHDKPYILNCSVGDVIRHDDDSCTLSVFNSIKNSQRAKYINPNSILFHSKFIDTQRDEIFNGLFDIFGRTSELSDSKVNVMSTHILQASLDISFKNMHESVMSPEFTLQRIGRCNRWGEFDTANLFIKLLTDRSERAVKDTLYRDDLTNNWFDYLLTLKNEITLDDLYIAYNDYNIQNKESINRFIRDKYQESVRSRSKIYPTKHTGVKSDVMNANSNKLRSNGTEFFYIMKNFSDDNYSDIFSTPVMVSIDIDFSESGNTLTRMKKVMTKLIGDERFDFKSVLSLKAKKDRVTLDHLRRNAKRSNTPYIAFDRYYHNIYGVINSNLLESFQ